MLEPGGRKVTSNGEAPMVEFDDVSKVYEVRQGLYGPRRRLFAVDHISLSINRGETLGVVGESGSGKTTLGYLLLNLIPATSGRISFDGRDLGSCSRRELAGVRRRMQIVFQDPFSSLDPRMPVASIVGEGLRRLQRSERAARVAQLLDEVGLGESFGARYPHQLSGGQRQRVGIARALAVRPELLVLDEPVAALDASVQSQVLNVLAELKELFALTYLLISHDLAVVRHLADRIAVVYLGKLVELAPTDDLFENPFHPYTQALLSAMPTLSTPRGERIVLKGDIPSPIEPPAHCRFASRCFRSVDESWTGTPPLREIAPKHWVACFNPAAPPWASTSRQTSVA
jgi:oligopeptide/dipeptide ABC transporter ATP-binding protein